MHEKRITILGTSILMVMILSCITFGSATWNAPQSVYPTSFVAENSSQIQVNDKITIDVDIKSGSKCWIYILAAEDASTWSNTNPDTGNFIYRSVSAESIGQHLAIATYTAQKTTYVVVNIVNKETTLTAAAASVAVQFTIESGSGGSDALDPMSFAPYLVIVAVIIIVVIIVAKKKKPNGNRIPSNTTTVSPSRSQKANDETYMEKKSVDAKLSKKVKAPSSVDKNAQILADAKEVRENVKKFAQARDFNGMYNYMMATGQKVLTKLMNISMNDPSNYDLGALLQLSYLAMILLQNITPNSELIIDELLPEINSDRQFLNWLVLDLSNLTKVQIKGKNVEFGEFNEEIVANLIIQKWDKCKILNKDETYMEKKSVDTKMSEKVKTPSSGDKNTQILADAKEVRENVKNFAQSRDFNGMYNYMMATGQKVMEKLMNISMNDPNVYDLGASLQLSYLAMILLQNITPNSELIIDELLPEINSDRQFLNWLVKDLSTLTKVQIKGKNVEFGEFDEDIVANLVIQKWDKCKILNG